MGEQTTREQRSDGRRQFVIAGLVLGFGLGGFVDGIVLHQVLQWHHMLTSTAPYSDGSVKSMEVNTLWDGLFHAVTWVFVVVGLRLLWGARRAGLATAGRGLVGLVAAGWGLFNLVEGLVDHHLLGIHHVRSGAGQLWYDLGFLALGAILLATGWALYRSAPTRLDPATVTT